MTLYNLLHNISQVQVSIQNKINCYLTCSRKMACGEIQTFRQPQRQFSFLHRKNSIQLLLNNYIYNHANIFKYHNLIKYTPHTNSNYHNESHIKNMGPSCSETHNGESKIKVWEVQYPFLCYLCMCRMEGQHAFQPFCRHKFKIYS